MSTHSSSQLAMAHRGEAEALIFNENELLDSDEEVSDIEEDLVFSLPVDIGETEDGDGTTVARATFCYR